MSGARRKAVVKYAPRQQTWSLKSLAGTLHLHFCSNRDCRLVYEDACTNPESNRTCALCRTGRRGWATRDPQECCIDNCDQVTTRENQERYSLAGPGPWYQCRTCRRAHGWSCSTALN